MAIIATVKQHDVEEGRGTVELIKFITRETETLYGSAGFNGIVKHDVIKAAKDWAIENSHTNSHDGDHIIILDTHIAEYAGNKTFLSPEYRSENNFNLVWEVN